MKLFLISASALVLAACTPAAQTTVAADAAAPAAEVAAPEAAPAAEVAFGQAAVYDIDPGHTSVTWRVNHLGLSKYTARFKTVNATLNFNPEDLAANSVEVTIDPRSVETDFGGDYKGTHPDSPYASWNDDLRLNPGWFNASAHPIITFKSTSAAQASQTTGTVTGDLTFLGVTRPVTLDVTYNGMVQLPWTPDQDRIGFSARTTLKRSDFGMNSNLEFIGDDVEIIIETEFLEAAAG
ncbi:MAG: YceI family protein [Hyphomonas sp.]|uniref:YceI family protein n=1 Tax=Hyphomonas sp. TaxID=87 RepID=UPI0034A03FF9